MSGELDGTLPVSVTHFLEHDHEVVHMHGGIATRMTFDSLEEMPIDTFLKDVAPTLAGKRDIAILGRDGVHESMYRLFGDTAVIYHGVRMEDAYIDDVYKELEDNKPLKLDLNLPYPLVRYTQLSGGEKSICVYIPERECLFRTYLGTSYPIWHPPLWLSVTMTSTNMPKAHKICAVPERSDTIQETQICELPFPNVHQNGEICFGHTSFGGIGNDNLTVAAAIQLTYNRFFMSEFNTDLMPCSKTNALYDYYKRLPKDPEIDAELERPHDDGSTLFLRIARCFKTRADMLGFPYVKLNSVYKDSY